MKSRRPPRNIDVEAAAKINLGWRVGPRREDGYHEVSGLMQTVSLTDKVEIVVEDHPGSLSLIVPGHPELENDANLVHKAARALADRVDEPPATLVAVHKSIPVAAGLGGGSADAAAALIGLSIAWGVRRTVRELIEIGGALGSDVPGIMVGGLVSVSGRGERVRGIGSFDAGWVVLGVGDEQASTAAVYDLFDQIGTQPSDALCHNDLEQAACEHVPGTRERIDAMRDATGGLAYVSGSGPTVVGVTSDEDTALQIASDVSAVFARTLVTQPCAWGVRLVAPAHPGGGVTGT